MSLGTSALTLLDWAKTRDPEGKTATVAELLSQNNGLVKTMTWIEGNLPTGHQSTVRTGLPSAAWRLLNNGVTPSKGNTAQILEACGMLETYSEVDKDIAELNGDLAAYRMLMAKGHIEAMNQEFASTLIYGNSSVDPEEFTGLAVRYSSLSAENARCIIDAGGTQSDNTSIWIVGWGEHTCTGIFPKGSKAGLFHEDLGLVTVQTGTGIATGRMRAYQDHWQWKCGVSVPDWRYVVRIANIDVSNLVADSSAADLSKVLTKATHRMQSLTGVKPVIYMNRTCLQYLDTQGRADVKSGGGLSYQNVDGQVRMQFRAIPIEIEDAIIETEARVV